MGALNFLLKLTVKHFFLDVDGYKNKNLQLEDGKQG